MGLLNVGLITASEVKWLKSNLLSQIECDRVTEIEATVQTNLFNQNEHKEIKIQTTKEISPKGLASRRVLVGVKRKD